MIKDISFLGCYLITFIHLTKRRLASDLSHNMSAQSYNAASRQYRNNKPSSLQPPSHRRLVHNMSRRLRSRNIRVLCCKTVCPTHQHSKPV